MLYSTFTTKTATGFRRGKQISCPQLIRINSRATLLPISFSASASCRCAPSGSLFPSSCNTLVHIPLSLLQNFSSHLRIFPSTVAFCGPTPFFPDQHSFSEASPNSCCPFSSSAIARCPLRERAAREPRATFPSPLDPPGLGIPGLSKTLGTPPPPLNQTITLGLSLFVNQTKLYLNFNTSLFFYLFD
jgi:hypothetical protein